MELIKGEFTEIEAYNKIIENWDLKYKLLSKGDFFAEIEMVYNDDFSLARERLSGKIEHTGNTLEDYFVFVIPKSKVPFIWFGKEVGAKNLLIFPKGNAYNALTFTGFDVYVVSIKKEVFISALNKKDVQVFLKMHEDSPQTLMLSKAFSVYIIKLFNFFLDSDVIRRGKNEAIISTIVKNLATYVNSIELCTSIKNKKDKKFERATNLINKNCTTIYSVSQVCALLNISESSLLKLFKEKYNVSPSSYIKSVRLNAVRREIYSSPADSIGSIASMYNFWHMGQFAKDFKNQFGYLPSEIRKKEKLKLTKEIL